MSSTATSGQVSPFPVYVDLISMIAGGDIVTARYSANTAEIIDRDIRKISDGAGGIFDFGFCQATGMGTALFATPPTLFRRAINIGSSPSA